MCGLVERMVSSSQPSPCSLTVTVRLWSVLVALARAVTFCAIWRITLELYHSFRLTHKMSLYRQMQRTRVIRLSVQVFVRRGNVGMAQGFFDHGQRCAAVETMACMGMT